jgi:hypothetical protein
MKVFSVGDLEDQLNNEAQLRELINYPNPDYNITFYVRSPNLPIYKFPKEPVSVLNQDKNSSIKEKSSNFSIIGERIYPNFLHIDNSLINNVLTDRGELACFPGASFVNDDDERVELVQEESGCRICIFNENKTTDSFNEHELYHYSVSYLSLYVSAEPHSTSYESQGSQKDAKTKKRTLTTAVDINSLRDAIGIYEEIPKLVRAKLESFPDISDAEFNRLTYLRLTYEKFWTDYAFKDYLLLRVLESDDIRTDRFLKWNYEDVDKKIRSRIRNINSNVATELLRLFANEELDTSKKILEGAKRQEIDNLIKDEKLGDDGKTLGKKCAQIAAKLVRPSFEERSDGHFKRSMHKIYPLKLWILHHVALFFWANIDPNDYEPHPVNKSVGSFITSINKKTAKESSELSKEFLRGCPELNYFPNLFFTNEEAKYAAVLIRPQWAYAKNK